MASDLFNNGQWLQPFFPTSRPVYPRDEVRSLEHKKAGETVAITSIKNQDQTKTNTTQNRNPELHIPRVLRCALECAKAGRYALQHKPGLKGISQLIDESWGCFDLVQLTAEAPDVPVKGEGGPFASSFLESLCPSLNACFALAVKQEVGSAQGYAVHFGEMCSCSKCYHGFRSAGHDGSLEPGTQSHELATLAETTGTAARR